MTTKYTPTSSDHGRSEQSEHKARTVSRRACLSCRERKIKCEGVQNCRNCTTLGVDCVFVPSHRGGKRRRRNLTGDHSPEPMYSHSPSLKGDSVGVHKDNRQVFPANPYEHNSFKQSNVEMDTLPSQISPVPQINAAQNSTPNRFPPPPPPHLVQRHTDPVKYVESQARSDFSAPIMVASAIPSTLHSIQCTLASLQQQINDIRQTQTYVSQRLKSEPDHDSINDSPKPFFAPSSTLLPAPSTKPVSPPPAKLSLATFGINDADLQSYDLPSVPLIVFLIDVYYDCFHPEFAFMLPKAKFLQSVNFETDAAMLQAMFAISCRLTAAETITAGAGAIHPYLVDPMYWVSRCEKWLSRVTHPIAKLKTSLLLAFFAVYDGQQGRARDLMAYARSIIDLHRLDLIDCDNRACTAGQIPLRQSYELLLPTELDRESFRRTFYNLWELQVTAAAMWSSPQDVPPFISTVRMPSCEATYADSLNDYDGNYFVYDDFYEAVFESDATTVEEDLMPLGFVRKRWRFNSACFRIASIKILADTVTQVHDMPADFVDDTDRRVRTLLRKVGGYRAGPMRIHMSLFATHQILYTVILLLHRIRAREKLVFVVQPTPYDAMTNYMENSISRVKSVPASKKTVSSFKALVHASYAAIDMVRTFVECRGGREDSACLKMGPFIGFSLSLCVPIIASKVVLQGVQLPSIKLILGDFANSEPSERTSSTATQSLRDVLDWTDDGILEPELGKPDLEMSIRMMKMLGQIWRGLRHEYEESVALMGRMTKVM
ncbi:hypothetical protein V1512DRAFT_257959 [Lipomyces arxii]|uniref:uncharacterized protein n=1 Tax=Lipomyces arxii TaxID=56418 RepID=UPI0034CF5FE4